MTIKDIAEAAGVSRGTVDRVLHHRGGVNHEIEKRVRSIATSMDYTPNRAGRILAARKQPLKIGCFLPGIGNEFFDDIIWGLKKAEQEFSDYGVSLVIQSIRGYNPNEHIKTMQSLIDCGCQALCACTIDTPLIRKNINQWIDSNIPIMTFNTDLTDTKRLCYVGSDYLRCGKTAAGLFRMFQPSDVHLLIITGSFYIKGHNERIRGFFQILKHYNLSYTLVDILESQDNDAISYATVNTALETNPNINCFYITAAGIKGACEAIQKHSKIFPDEKHWVMTFDDTTPTYNLIQSGLIDFTISQEPIDQGYYVIHSMFDYFLNGQKTIPANHIIPEQIKIKENLSSYE